MNESSGTQETVLQQVGPVFTARETVSVHDQPPRLLLRVMDTWGLRRAPWLVFFLMFFVAVGVTVMCVRLRLGDDVTASVCAALTCGLIFGTAIAVWFSIRGESSEFPVIKKRRITVRLKAHSLDKPVCCPICLVETEPGERVITLDCNHTYHVECICTWTKRVAICPACRFNLPTTVSSASTSRAVSPSPPV